MKTWIAVVCLTLSTCAPAQPPNIYSTDGQYLGTLSSNPYDANSVSNPYSRHGNPYEPESITNPYGRHGNPYSPDSVSNPYTTSSPRYWGEDR